MKREEIFKKLQDATFAHLERDIPKKDDKKSDENTVYADGWRLLRERKWEFRSNNIVLATIFRKPTDKFSLWFKTPMLYAKLIDVIGTTYQYDSFEEATDAFQKLIKSTTDWCHAVLHCVNIITENHNES